MKLLSRAIITASSFCVLGFDTIWAAKTFVGPTTVTCPLGQPCGRFDEPEGAGIFTDQEGSDLVYSIFEGASVFDCPDACSDSEYKTFVGPATVTCPLGQPCGRFDEPEGAGIFTDQEGSDLVYSIFEGASVYDCVHACSDSKYKTFVGPATVTCPLGQPCGRFDEPEGAGIFTDQEGSDLVYSVLEGASMYDCVHACSDTSEGTITTLRIALMLSLLVTSLLFSV
eukprot:CAMPEP_0197734064 /NCGR_PEP_ID=MMETSP1434-20131217/44232_1 /TAXON_ID=265543 /ORGANISM="Minutocellus polymorphus, Strain CCMP3303" /LENGTH=225 /DNA_ID=CAMNT_0043321471 /DNA_START=175 /DNA_END=852 /DNA_ORIENTATION=-